MKDKVNEQSYKIIEDYMLKCIGDSAHDKEHVYRVLYVAMDIASHEEKVDYNVLITAYLLHDIGRKEQFEDPSLCHAIIGAEKAYAFLVREGFDVDFSYKVAKCIRSHRYRSSNPPESIEEKILFDADKIDITGTLGIARTLVYRGALGEPLYSLNKNGQVSDGQKIVNLRFFKNTNSNSKSFIPCFILKEEVKLQQNDKI